MQLGKEKASKVLSKLPEQVVEDLTAEIVRLRDVSWEDAESVVGEAYKSLVSNEVAGRGGLELAKQLLADSVGAERADEIMERLGATLAEMPFEGLRRADARQLVTFLADEHPQTIALVLAHLGPAQSAIVLSGLERGRQADVAQRIALMEQASPDMIRLVERELDRRMVDRHDAAGAVRRRRRPAARGDHQPGRPVDRAHDPRGPGVGEPRARRAGAGADVRVRGHRDARRRGGAARAAQRRERRPRLALKGTSTVVREKIMRNLSTRAAENLAEEIELLGPRRLSEVEEAQAEGRQRDPRARDRPARS